jgi:hypothetical protein
MFKYNTNKIRRKPVQESMDRIVVSTTDDGNSGSSYPCFISIRIRWAWVYVSTAGFVVCWCLVLISHKMDTFSDDIFSVFDESAEERVPTANSDEKHSIQVLEIQPDVK